MEGLLIVLIGLLLGVTTCLVRYYLAVKSLSKQIEEKLVEESHRRITLKNQPKSLVTLTNRIESLFTQIEKTKLVAVQEKKTMDMAISNIAHDIRTPLTVASGYAQQSLRSSREDDMAMEKISKNLLTVSKRLEALLEYRRLTEGAIQPQFQDVDFSQLVVKSILPYYDMFQETGITLDIQVTPDIQCEMDPDIFERLFQNIISNVLKHGKTQAHLTLQKKVVMTSLNSVMLMIMGRANLGLLDIKTIQDLLPFSKDYNLLIVGLIAVTIVIASLIAFLNTRLGQAYIATGDNRDMARSFGINTDSMEVMGLVISNGIIALSGALISQQDGYADVSKGIGVIVIGLASIIIGEVLYTTNLTLLERLIAICVGSILYQFLLTAVIALGFNTNYLKLFSAIVLALCLISPVLRRKFFKGVSLSR